MNSLAQFSVNPNSVLLSSECGDLLCSCLKLFSWPSGKVLFFEEFCSQLNCQSHEVCSYRSFLCDILLDVCSLEIECCATKSKIALFLMENLQSRVLQNCQEIEMVFLLGIGCVLLSTSLSF